MKTLLGFLIFTTSWLSLPNLDVITQALSSGDVEVLAGYFDESVEIAVVDEEDIYDKAEAKTILATFFNGNKPTKFDQVHKGTSKGQDSVYCIGNLKTATNSYRVYVFLRVDGSKQFIQELRFDKE
ncbi:MAG: DUF4783 domain-containing protein [Bacteroidota bacterium]